MAPTAHSRLYFDTLLDRLENRIDQKVRLIPTGEVLYRMHLRLASGDVPRMTEIADLYRDEVHLNSVGQWLSGVTAASVITGTDASVFGKPRRWYGDNADFSGELVQTVRSVVAEVLSERIPSISRVDNLIE
jgi:hypothetical protein